MLSLLVKTIDHPNAAELARFNANGSVDATFGTDGVTTIPGRASSLALQSHGNILAAGGSPHAGAIFRFSNSGVLDKSFGQKRAAIMPTDLAFYVGSIALQKDGKIVAEAGDSDVFVRFNTDGTIDTSFGDNGVLPIHISLREAVSFKIIQDANGELILAGSTQTPNSHDETTISFYTPALVGITTDSSQPAVQFAHLTHSEH